MLLAIDAGNTNTVFALFEGERLINQWRIASDARRTADEYAVWLLQLMQRAELKPDQVHYAIAACVVPAALFELKTFVKRYFATSLRVVGEAKLNPGIDVRVPRPQEVGADRLVNAAAVWQEHAAPCIVVDFGTATTFDVVEDGAYCGGVIAPGVHLSLQALERAAARLPNVSIVAPEKAIGTDTVSAMQSGLYYGYAGLIEGITSRIAQEMTAKPRIIATGGLAPLYAAATPSIQQVEPDLTLHGLCLIHRLNQKEET